MACSNPIPHSRSRRSYDFTNHIHDYAIQVLELAARLRNHILFRNALCHVVGAWSNEDRFEISDDQLRQIVERAHNDIMVMVMQIQQKIMEIIYKEKSTDGKCIQNTQPLDFKSSIGLQEREDTTKKRCGRSSKRVIIRMSMLLPCLSTSEDSKKGAFWIAHSCWRVT